MLNTVIHIVIFLSKVICGDRTGSDGSCICVIEVVLCPGSINQLHQRGIHRTQNNQEKIQRE